MRLIFIFHFVIFFALGFCSLLGKPGKNKKKCLRHRISSDEEDERDLKKIRWADEDIPADLKKIVDENLNDTFVEYLHSNVLVPEEGLFLNYCIKKGKTEILRTFFEMSRRVYGHDVFEPLFWALKLAASLSKPEIIKALAKHEFIDTDEREEILLQWILDSKNLKMLKTCLDNGIDFDSWRTRRGQTLSHLAVQMNWLSVADSICEFRKKDKSGLTPIFYAKSAEMAKLIRSKCPGARDDYGKTGKTAWQVALLLNNEELLNAMISPERRFKKFRGKQLNYYNIDWLLSASLLKINRDFIVKDSFKQIQSVKDKWYRPRHKFFIKFVGEYGIDAGGLKVDWMTTLLNTFFIQNPLGSVADFTAPIFKLVEEEGSLYAPNTAYKPEIFKFVGSILGVAFAMNVPIKQKFIPSLYKSLMHKEIILDSDLQEQSPTTFRGLQYLTNPFVRLSEMQLTLPSNPSAHVTKRNVPTYIREYSRDVLIGRYQKHISELVSGFESVQPVKVNLFFKLDEFKKHLTGKPADYTAEEFMENCFCEDKQTRQALKRLIGEMTSKQRVLLLKFITGFDALPANGFAGWTKRISVNVDRRLVGKFPTSSTCSFHLNVPPFISYEAFSRSLITAIENSETTDNEPGVRSHSEGIVLEFESGPDIDDDYWFSLTPESESDVEFSLGDSDSESEDGQNENLSTSSRGRVNSHRERNSRHRLIAFPDF